MKTTTVFFRNCGLGLLLLLVGFGVQAQQVQVQVTDMKSAKGQIVVRVFTDNEHFKKEESYKTFLFTKQGLVNGTITLQFNLEPGVYGITVLDDENGNGDMDKNIIGIPKEGFGFSNFYLEKMKRPVFDDFKITIKAAANRVPIRMKYL